MSGHEQELVARAFSSNFIAPVGPQLDAFEAAVGQYLRREVHCVALTSGSAALHVALILAGIGAGDEVWMSSMTFAGGVFPVNYLGATPRFFDVDPRSWTMDTQLLAEQLEVAARSGRLPKAIVPTDLYGQSVDIDTLEHLCSHYGVCLIVDSAESLGAEFRNGRRAGTAGDASILSFNGNKIITTSGGGMLVSQHKSWAEKARFLSTQARDPAPHYEHSVTGYNYRLSNICAAIGLGQILVIEDRVNRRRQIFEAYRSGLAGSGIEFMPEPSGYRSTRWLTTIVVDPAIVGVDRDAIRIALLQKGIETRPLWKPMHLQPLFVAAPYHGRKLDEKLFQLGLCLPSGSDMTDDEQAEVIGHIWSLIQAGR
jgi:pyridoxal phosphate-dependent aminotransferase EpsN